MATVIGSAIVDVIPGTDAFASSLTSKLKTIVSNLPLSGAVIGAAVGITAVLFKIGEDFEHLNDTIIQKTGASGTALKGLEQSAKDVFSTAIGANFQNVGDAISEISVRTGLAGKALDAFATKEIELGTITKTNVGQNVQDTTAIFTQFGVAADQQSGKLDVLFKASQSSGVGISTFDTQMKAAAPTAQLLGLNVDQTAAFVAKMAAVGIPASRMLMSLGSEFQKAAQAGRAPTTVIQDMITQLKAAPTFQDAATLAMTKYGVAGAQAAKLVTEVRAGSFDFGQTLAAITNGQGGILSTATATETLGQKFGVLKNLLMTDLEPAATGVLDFVTMVFDFVAGMVSKMGPAFAALGAIISGTTGFVTHHTAVVEYAAAVIGTVMVPALVAWGVAQARVAVSSVISFVSSVGAGALDAAVSIGLLANADNYLTVTLTTMGIAAGAAALGIGLLIVQYEQMQSSAKSAAATLVKSAQSPQQAISQLTALQAANREEMNSGLNVLGLHIFATDSAAKKAAEAGAAYKAETAQLKTLTDGQQTAADTTTAASNSISSALTAQGLTIQTIGDASKLSSDQVQALADSMGIDLTQASSSAIDKLTTQAITLGYASSSALRLATDTQTLSDWTQDATKRTQAFTDATDALMGSQTSAEGAAINFQQSLADLVTKLTGVKYSTDLTTQSGRDQQTAIMNAVDATQKQIDAEQQSGMSLDVLRPKIAQNIADLDAVLAHAGLTTAQIAALNTQYDLTPAAIALITPAVDGMNVALAGTQSQLSGLLGLGQQLPGLFGGIAQLIRQVPAGTVAAAAALAAKPQSQVGIKAGQGHAAGGPVFPGTAYPVGEKGWEMFEPTVPGVILPHDLSASLAGIGSSQLPLGAYSTSAPQVNLTLQMGGVHFHGQQPSPADAAAAGAAAASGAVDTVVAKRALLMSAITAAG